MDALDGNAIAGQLVEVFGVEMTTAIATCGNCGAVRQLAEAAVYLGGPGTVARCRSCENVLVVITAVHGTACVDLQGLADVRMP
jgi:hypothetical protein